MSTTDVPVLSHEEGAFRLVETLRALQATIAGFVMPPTPIDAESRPRYRQLPDAFFVALAVALESTPQLLAVLQAAAISLTPADIRDMLRHGEAYLPVADELERFARAIRHTVSVRRARVGRLGASAYRMIKGMNLSDGTAVAIPEIDAMKRAFPNSGRRRKPAEPGAVKAKQVA